MSLSYRVMSFLFACTIFMGCGKSKSNNNTNADTGKSKVVQYFVHGDPKKIIEGASLNKSSKMNMHNFKQFNDYSLFNAAIFYEKSPLFSQEYNRSAESGQEPTTEDETTKKLDRYFFEQNGDNSFIYSSETSSLAFKFVKDQGYLKIDNVSLDGVDFQVEHLHFSMLPDESAFSVLVYFNTREDGNILAAFIFTKHADALDVSREVQGDQAYNFLMGPGIKVRWDTKYRVNIKLCGNFPYHIEKATQRAVGLWQSPLRNKLAVDVTQVSSFPPFSDLSSHCIYLVDSFLTEGEKYSNPGTTLFAANPATKTIVDADIFLWKQEFQKFEYGYSALNQSYIEHVIGHELGHFLGLDHQFSGIKSIMSYSEDRLQLWEYDEKAIRHLYE